MNSPRQGIFPLSAVCPNENHHVWQYHRARLDVRAIIVLALRRPCGALIFEDVALIIETGQRRG